MNAYAASRYLYFPIIFVFHSAPRLRHNIIMQATNMESNQDSATNMESNEERKERIKAEARAYALSGTKQRIVLTEKEKKDRKKEQRKKRRQIQKDEKEKLDRKREQTRIRVKRCRERKREIAEQENENASKENEMPMGMKELRERMDRLENRQAIAVKENTEKGNEDAAGMEELEERLGRLEQTVSVPKSNQENEREDEIDELVDEFNSGKQFVLDHAVSIHKNLTIKDFLVNPNDLLVQFNLLKSKNLYLLSSTHT